jgi:hypothetical protein
VYAAAPQVERTITVSATPVPATPTNPPGGGEVG